MGDKVYFLANDGVRGTELWVTGSTQAGTRIVQDLTPGANGTTFPTNRQLLAPPVAP